MGASIRKSITHNHASNMKRYLILLLVYLPLLLTAQTPQHHHPQSTRISQSINLFGLQMYQELSETEGNLFFSPISMHTAFTMVWMGARGETREEMSGVLQFSLAPGEGEREMAFGYGQVLDQLNPDSNTVTLKMSNAVWVQEDMGLQPAFEDILRAQMQAPPRPVNFREAPMEVREQINQRVAEQTEDKIQDLMPEDSIDGDTRMVLTNAIYFKGDWASAFPEASTHPAPFHLSRDESVAVPMMHQKGRFAGRRLSNGGEALVLPYAGDRVVMLILLPPEEVAGQPVDHPLAAWEATLPDVNAEDPEQLHEMETLFMEAFDQVHPQTHVYLPRFTMTQTFDLVDTMKNLGMPRAFDPVNADFSGMTSEERLFIGAAVHKSFVEVNETGTEAAAATGIAMQRLSAVIDEPPPRVFRADRPFFFMLIDTRTNSTLFMGRIVDPR